MQIRNFYKNVKLLESIGYFLKPKNNPEDIKMSKGKKVQKEQPIRGDIATSTETFVNLKRQIGSNNKRDPNIPTVWSTKDGTHKIADMNIAFLLTAIGHCNKNLAIALKAMGGSVRKVEFWMRKLDELNEGLDLKGLENSLKESLQEANTMRNKTREQKFKAEEKVVIE